VSWESRPVLVRAPATSANLGPGFDALGLALTLYDEVEARIRPAGLAIEVSGTGAEAAAAGEGHLVVRAMRAAFDKLGRQPPGIGLRCKNAIPQGVGLGSSAAAIVAGVLAASALAGEYDPLPGGSGALAGKADPLAGGSGALAGKADPLPGESGALASPAVLRLAAQLEGHPDNVTACMMGGLTIAWTDESGARAARLTPLPELAPVICIPPDALATSVARQALPASVPHPDAAANSARAALLIAALTLDPGLLLAATEDFLHQRYRAAAMPRTAELIGQLRAAGIPAVVSGAGPAVLALTVAGRERGPDLVRSLAAGTGAAWQVRPLQVANGGAITRPVQAG
jgi:homoserine kinase